MGSDDLGTSAHQSTADLVFPPLPLALTLRAIGNQFISSSTCMLAVLEFIACNPWTRYKNTRCISSVYPMSAQRNDAATENLDSTRGRGRGRGRGFRGRPRGSGGFGRGGPSHHAGGASSIVSQQRGRNNQTKRLPLTHCSFRFTPFLP